ncbi:hypothetical protein FJY68_05285 [candidate division WOR-3 bacterium]|uniref:Uncharacterized protein n=1 Tax=candidate division WOR-3 bacterium TaxID=2052148 RepID=A0A937XGK9_UNCW3|nr:hypothetical protein [candidate division WOR-3 bacterium]
MLRLTMQVRLGICSLLLALVLAGCRYNDPCPVYVTNHSSHTPLLEVAQDSLFETDWQAFLLIPQDSAFVGYFPRGTVLWLEGQPDHSRVASNTSIFGGVPVAITILRKTTFLFVDDSLGDPVLRVIQ